MQNSLFEISPNDPDLSLDAAFTLLDERMEADLLAAIRQLQTPVIPQRHVPDERVYLIRSCLQKAIRRGETATALRMAYALQQVNEEALYRRMSVIALEDIGLGNLPLVNRFLWVQGKHAWRREAGAARILTYFINEFCQSVKDRNSCDIKITYHRHPGLAAERRSFARLEDAALVNIIRDGTKPLAARAMAAHYLAGVREGEYEHLLGRARNLSSLLDAYRKMAVPVEVLYAIRRGATAQQEGMHTALGLLAALRTELPHPAATADDLLVLPRVGPYLSASLDLHTREGLAAYHTAIRRDAGLRRKLQALAPGHEAADVLGACLFRMEGGQVNQRLDYPPAVTIYPDSMRLYLEAKGLPAERQEDAVAAVRAHLETINAARQAQYP